MKRCIERHEDSDIIAYYFRGLHFLTKEEAIKIAKLYPNGIKEIEKFYYCIGIPDFVNVNESLSKNEVIYYKDEELDL